MQSFTYVNVVFSPLDFTTGLLSMSDAPATRTVYSMVATVVSALFFTRLLLYNCSHIALV